MRLDFAKKLQDLGYDIIEYSESEFTIRCSEYRDYSGNSLFFPAITIHASLDKLSERWFERNLINKHEQYMDKNYPGWREREAQREEVAKS